MNPTVTNNARVAALVALALAIAAMGIYVAEADDAPGAAEEALVTVARTVTAEGRSRAHVGGRSAPVGTLSAVGQTLVAVHGQSDQLRLKSPAAQRHALDQYAGEELAAELRRYRERLTEYRSVQQTLREVTEHGRERALEAQSLQGALEEIDAADPDLVTPGSPDRRVVRAAAATAITPPR